MRSAKDSLSACKAADVTIKISFVTRLIRNRHLSMDSRPATMIGRPGFCGGLGGGRASFDRCHRARGQLRPELAENQWVVGVWLCFGALFSGRRNKFLFALAQYAGDVSGHRGQRGTPTPPAPGDVFSGAMPVTHVRRPCSVQAPETRMACGQQVCRSRP